jgi:defect-in-organelle-trafficking protein DotB
MYWRSGLPVQNKRASLMTLPIINLSGVAIIKAIDQGIDELFQHGVSDITIQADDYIWAYHGRIHKCVSTRRLDESEVSSLVRHYYKSDGAFGMLGSGQPLDFEVEIRPKVHDTPPDPDYLVRCRVNVTRCRVAGVADASSITLRTIPGLPPRLSDLNLEKEITETLFPAQGLVLIVGETGSGKSTLLAAANRQRQERVDKPVKILTFEDPIEFVYARLPVWSEEKKLPGPPVKPRMPEVSQVQIGRHLKSFDDVTRNILRRKADVIVMGEMRDRVSVETGLLLAQTGHATYGTLHCETPAQAIPRVISEFETEAQPSVANKLLDSLRLVVAQKIVADTKGKGRAFRSWIVFDHKLKMRMTEIPFAKWSNFLTEHMSKSGADFASQASAACLAGEISNEAFGYVAGFNPLEVREYFAATQKQEGHE